MMMSNGGTSYEWQFDPDDDVDFVADDGAMSMDIESFLSILDENPPDDSSQSGLADPSISITPYNESATPVDANEHFQTLDDHSEASASKTVCSSGSSDYEKQAINHGSSTVGPLPDVASTQFLSWAPGDWSVPIPPGGRTSGLANNVASSSHYDTQQTNFESDQMMDKSGGLTVGIQFIDGSEYPMPNFMNRNESSYSVPVYDNGMLFNDKIASNQHVEQQYVNTKGGFLSSESSTDSHSILPNRRKIVSAMEGRDEEKSCDVVDRLFSESLPMAHNFVSKKDNYIKKERETKQSRHFININNSLIPPAPSFSNFDIKIKNQNVPVKDENPSKFASFTNINSFSQQKIGKNITYIDVDDPDICILEDLSEPPRKHPSLDMKPPIFAAAQRSSSIGTPPVHISGFNNSRAKPNDERIVYRVALQDLSQPKSEAYAPDGALAVQLLRHQRIALSWMVQKETKSIHCFGGILADDQGLGKTISTIALILKERSPSSNAPTTEVKKIETETFNLDDDDEDEQPKTNSSEIQKNKTLVEFKNTNANNSVNAKSRPAAGTLVVCPTSVLRQWNDELHNKVSNEANLSVLVYHGANRTKDPTELAKYDVVLTTYAIVSMEVPKQPLVDEDDDETRKHNDHHHPVGISPGKKRKYPPGKGSKKGKKGINSELFESLARPLAKVRWFRVVLDEAQSIKNHRTQVARACWGLRAKRRWCLSGTPIQNSIDDLYSYFRFLKYDPYAVYKSFCSTIKLPIQKSSATGYKKLQAVLKTIMLRRTKATLLDGEPIIYLPPKTINLKKVDFTPEERDFYCRLEADSRAQFAEYAAAGTVKQNYVNILLMLLRLRQACDHPLLVKGCNSNSEWKSSLEKAKKLEPEKRIRLLNCLEASLAICSICSDPPEDAVVTTCEHVFCNQCILEHLASDESQCPSSKCKVILTASSIFSKSTLKISLSDQPTPSSVTVKDEVVEACNSSNIAAAEALDSSKIKAAVEVLDNIVKPKEIGKEIVREKAIVFSQWTRMLDLLEACLKDSKIGYRRLDGTMSIVARDKAVKDFNTLPEVNVMIMSLKAASLGLNMVAACHVLLLDLWWNPTTEDQAIDRAHRIGQTRPVSVLRLTVKDTVEDRILALQQKKREMVASAFGEDESGGSQTRLTVDDLKYLFQF